MGWWRWDYIVWPRHDIWQPLLPWFRWNISFKMGSWNLVKDAPHQGCYNSLFWSSALIITLLLDNEEFFSPKTLATIVVDNNTVIDHQRTPPVSPLTSPGVPCTTAYGASSERKYIPDYLIPVSLDVIHQLQYKITAKSWPSSYLCLSVMEILSINSIFACYLSGIGICMGSIIVRRLQGWPRSQAHAFKSFQETVFTICIPVELIFLTKLKGDVGQYQSFSSQLSSCVIWFNDSQQASYLHTIYNLIATGASDLLSCCVSSSMKCFVESVRTLWWHGTRSVATWHNWHNYQLLITLS